MRSQFIPHFLTDQQKQVRLTCTRDFVETADGDPSFLKSIVTGGKSWFYMYNLQMKGQSTAGLSLGALRPVKVRQQKSNVETLLIAFFDAKGLFHREFIHPGQTVTSTVYLAVMKYLMYHICRSRSEYCEQGNWSLLHDNAPTHTATL